jgi:hypothetical protein
LPAATAVAHDAAAGSVLVVVVDDVVVTLGAVVAVLDEVVVAVEEVVVEGGGAHRVRTVSTRHAASTCWRHVRFTRVLQRFTAARLVPTHCPCAASVAQAETSVPQSLEHGFFAAATTAGAVTVGTSAIARSSAL